MYKKTQGEIFGIALLFVVIIVGFLIYSQISIDDDKDLEREEQYRLLSSTALNSILKQSTGCKSIERSDDSLKTVITQCIYDKEFREIDPEYFCDGEQKQICAYSEEIINNTLKKLFNETNLNLGTIPYRFTTFIKDDTKVSFGDLEFTNLGTINFSNKIISKSNYRKLGYQRVSSNPLVWETLSGDIEVELYLYYR